MKCFFIRIMRSTIAAVIFTALLPPALYAELSLTRVDGWSGAAAHRWDIDIYSSSSLSSPLVASTNRRDSVTVFFGGSLKLAYLIDTSRFNYLSHTLGKFDSTEGEQLALLLHDKTYEVWDRSSIITAIHIIVLSLESTWQDSAIFFHKYTPPNPPTSVALLETIRRPGSTTDQLFVSLGAWIEEVVYTERLKGFQRVWTQFPGAYTDIGVNPTFAITSFGDRLCYLNTKGGYKSYNFSGFLASQSHSEGVELRKLPFTDSKIYINQASLQGGCTGVGITGSSSLSSTQKVIAAGDLITGNSSTEILVSKHEGRSCPYGSEGSGSMDVTDLFLVSSDLALTKYVDSFTAPIPSLFHSAYINAFPGSYLGFSRNMNVLYQVNTLTGEFLDSTTAPLSETILGWYDIFGDGNKYLISQSGAQLTAWTFDIVTGTKDEPQSALPITFALSNMAPNPFNPTAGFTLSSPAKSDVTIAVYNLLGQRVDKIFSGTVSAGEYHFEWRADDFASGLYFVRAVNGDGYTVTRKALLLK